MEGVKTILMLALVLTAISGIAFAQAANDSVTAVTGTFTDFSKGKITRDAVKTEISNRYAAGTLTRADLKKVITVAYNHNKLKREDLRWLLGQMYKEGKLTRADLRWVLTEAYKNNELTRDDLRFVIAQGYKNGQLTRADLKFLVTEAYKAGELKRSDMVWLITHAYKSGDLTRDDVKWVVAQAYKNGELTREDLRDLLVASYKSGQLTRADVKWLLMQMYKNNELTREDIRVLLTAAYNHGELTRADVKWLLMEAYKAKELTKDDVKWILGEAYKRGELRKADVLWVLNEAYKANELKTTDISEADVTGAAVVTQPAAVPSVETITEPNAATATDATAPAGTVTPVEETKAAAPAESVIKTKQGWVLYKYALVPTEKHRIGMEALIGYVESVGKDATGLVSLKNQFVSQRDQLKAAADANDYAKGKDLVRQMKDTVASFKTEAKTLVAGNETAAKAAVDAALAQNSDYLDSLVTEAREATRDRNLELFDLTSARAQGKLDKAKGKGADVSALQAKLDEIKELRSSFIDAANGWVEACKGEGIGKCHTTEKVDAISMRETIARKYQELAALAKTVGQSQRVAAAIENGRKILSNGEKLLDTAAKRGIDVSAERTELASIKALVDSAESKSNSGDLAGAIADLKQAQEKFKSLKEDVASRRKAR